MKSRAGLPSEAIYQLSYILLQNILKAGGFSLMLSKTYTCMGLWNHLQVAENFKVKL